MLLYFDDEADFAERLARTAGLEARRVERHRFPDGEMKLTLPVPLPPTAVVLRSLHRPNEKLIELVLLADTARALGARALTLVAPYLAYMRQDKAFHPGETVSQQIVGRMLAARFDTVVTVDPHLHRVARLADAVPAQRAIALSAAPLIGAYYAARQPRPLLLGPDAESEQWVKAAAGTSFDCAVCTKHRANDRDVRIELPAVPLAGRDVVLLDDVASTGGTLLQCARKAVAAGAARVDAAVTHALLDAAAFAQLSAAGVAEVISTDTVPHSTNRISVVDLVARALK
ncbi:MAG TPA: ribose-phosphate diphosphokinase [Burkholderiaceae bacterium]|nr:ribose-phosphate diphosphokinase [Burkholderiaceae bacterium]